MTRRFLMPGLIALTLAAATAFICRRAPMEARAQDAAPVKQTAQAIRTSPLQGSRSCATSVCHGGVELHKPQSEFTTWLSLDPHARAYDTLLNARARTIAENLWADRTVAHEAPLCLKCHVDPNYERARPSFRQQDGVGCESCHGAAESWQQNHYRPGWQRRGMNDTESLPGRARICVDCHVGVPGNEVDHDLIAAGHPALRFEFATYFANLPPHWDVAKDKATPDFEARAWVAGQLVTASRAMELLAHRADPDSGKIWPEFAEFDCFACHHDLQASSWRQTNAHLENRRPGSLRLGDWYTALLPELFAGAKNESANKMLSAMRDPIRPRQEIAKNAKALATSLEAVARKPADTRWLDQVRRSRLDANWDQTSQHFLALLSLQQTDKDSNRPKDAALADLIAALRNRLSFGPGHDSPRGYAPGFKR
jgi:hypothetical protein